jgi:hypothetical protein
MRYVCTLFSSQYLEMHLVSHHCLCVEERLREAVSQYSFPVSLSYLPCIVLFAFIRSIFNHVQARYGDGLYVGHALAAYALQSHFDGSEANPVPGGWKAIVKEAVDSTRAAFQVRHIVYARGLNYYLKRLLVVSSGELG